MLWLEQLWWWFFDQEVLHVYVDSLTGAALLCRIHQSRTVRSLCWESPPLPAQWDGIQCVDYI